MSMVDFSRGELSPMMRYRKDLEAYHKGVETLERFLPTARGGLERGPGSQVIELLPQSDRAPAVRMITLGATGLDHVIPKVSADDTLIFPLEAEPDDATASYDTGFRTVDIPKNGELDFLLSFTEYGDADDIVVYWVNSGGNPCFYQRIWNYNTSYEFPSIDFDDTRDVRVAQVENSAYIIAKTHIYRIYWDKDKVVPAWELAHSYSERDVVYYEVGTSVYFFECTESHTSSAIISPEVGGGSYWRPVYQPFLSWEIISPRVGHELLKGIGIPSDPYRWVANTTWASDTDYVPGDAVVVDVDGTPTVFECNEAHTTGDVTGLYPTDNSPAKDWDGYWVSYNATDHPLDDTITDDDKIYHRSTFAFREETVPREMVVHHNRLIFAGSSIRPSTIFGSEVYHYMDFGAGINDDDPWIVTMSGDKVGRILWLAVTDQLYIGTSGGIFAVNGVITPTQFQLRKVTSHSTSEIKAISAAGSLLFFHKDKQTLREVEYADQAENYRAFDVSIYSPHLFDEYKAIKMIVVNEPSLVIWILREDGTLVSLSYEKTVGMYAFARHELHGQVFDIVAGRNGEFYAIIVFPVTGIRQLIRIGSYDITYGTNSIENVHLDGLLSFVNIDTRNEFSLSVKNASMFDWYVDNSITAVSDLAGRETALSAPSAELSGLLSQCGLEHLDEIPSLDLSGNSLSGAVTGLETLMVNYGGNASLNLSGNNLDAWEMDSIPATWVSIDLSDNDFPAGQFVFIFDAILASLAVTPRVGTLDFTGYGALTANDALAEAKTLKNTHGWTVLIDNEAGWEGEQVIFNGNGNTSGTAPTAMDCLYKGSIEIPGENTLVKTGYDFFGWSSEVTGLAEYTEGNTYTKEVEGSVTLYAVWIAASEVKYNANGGVTPPVDSNTYNPGDTVTILSGIPARSGYSFIGWSFLASGTGTVYTAGDTITMGSSAITLYAQWKANTYRVTFNLNGATKGTTPTSMTGEYASVITLPSPSGVHKYYNGQWTKFRRWNTRSDGKGYAYNAGSSYTITTPSNHTLYAEYTTYSVGDDGPHGGVITQDLGSYANRQFTVPSPALGDTVVLSSGTVEDKPTYVWRYVEMMKTDWSSGRSFNSNWTIGYVSNGIVWRNPLVGYLKTALTGGHLDNLGNTRYWTGKGGKTVIFFIVISETYYYVDIPTSTEKSTSNKNNSYGYRLGKGI